MMVHYRIVTDHWLGYEVQSWRWWWPIWMQCFGPHGFTNTHRTIQEAEAFARQKALGARPIGLARRRVVKNLGPMTTAVPLVGKGERDHD